MGFSWLNGIYPDKMSFLLIGCLLWLHCVSWVGSEDERKRDDEKCIFFSLGKPGRKAPYSTWSFLVSWMVNWCVTSWNLCNQMFFNWYKTLTRTIMKGTNPLCYMLFYSIILTHSWDRTIYLTNSYSISYLYCSLHLHYKV